MADNDIKFDGFDGTTKVTQFITFIRRKALEAGRQRDVEWIADFAATYLDGEAFTWHLNLDPEVQVDWTKLQRALMARYNSNSATSSDIRGPIPTSLVAEAPAAAPPPPPVQTPKTSTLLDGRIRVEGTGRIGYISQYLDEEFNVFVYGSSASDAVRVTIDPKSFIHGIRLPEFQLPFRSLGIIRSRTWSFHPRSNLHANLIATTVPGVRPIKTMPTDLDGTASNLVWSYSPADQQIRAIYTEGPCTYVLSSIMNTQNRRILLVSDVAEVIKCRPQIQFDQVTLRFEAN